MSVLRDSNAQLYTPIYDKFMLESYAKVPQQHLAGFIEVEDNTKQYLVDDLSGLGTWDDTDEGEAGNTEDPVLGYPKTFTPTKKTKTIQVSFESVDDDEYALLKKTTQAEEMGIGAGDSVQRATAAVILDGFTTAGPDGQYLWGTSHPKNREETGVTYSNLLSGAFSHDNLELAETQIASNFFTMKGIPIQPTEAVTLYHPPALRGAVKRVLSERALERPGTTNRDINRFVGAGTFYDYMPTEWKYLDASMGGSNTVWGMVFKSYGHLKIVWRKRPSYTSWVDYNAELYNYKGSMRFIAGASNWRAGFFSTGA